ncbi:hypothetical protein DQ04_05791010 [Trypanosoma grayi]|uniref:hypothetical protein n=1 Tax=Trypanosoma grayi TaxID=71804 RepID=UPI0004F40B35|nr:hypothetical protein DQ04_05791010 [Trypanosoma grayi]KEG09109.1 hypothetical protein DQ04_05791010 [Trypanosoma grayi]
MPQKHIFARPSNVVEAGDPVSKFNAIHRIHNLRQSLSSIVASRAASAERYVTPRDDVCCDAGLASVAPTQTAARDPHNSAAGRFLVSTQRRVEELLRENHRLELQCMTQEEDLTELKVELELCKKRQLQQQQPITAAYDVRKQRPNVCKTPSLSRRSKAPRPTQEETDIDDTLGASQFLSLTGELDEAARRLVDVARTVFPQLRVAAAGPNADDLVATRDVLNFIECNLPDWCRLSHECAALGSTHTLFSETLMDLESDHLTWHSTILSIVERLQVAEAKQRRSAREKNRQIRELRGEVQSLLADVTRIAGERDAWNDRCENLERALCRQVEEHAAGRELVEQLQRECEALRVSASKEGTTSAAAVECGGSSTTLSHANDDTAENSVCVENSSVDEDVAPPATPLHDAKRLHASVRRLMREREALQKKLDARTKALTEAESQRQAVGVEKEQLEAQVAMLQMELERLQKEVVETKQAPSPPPLPPSPSLGGVTAEKEFSTPEVRRFLQPVVYRHFGDAAPPRPVVDLSSVIHAFDTDVLAVTGEDEAVRSTGLFFHIGCTIVNELGLFTDSAAASEDAWRRFLLQIQDGFIDNTYHNADHAADVAQFFYVLLSHSGLIPYMSRVELVAAVMASLCVEYRPAGLSGLFLAAARDPAAAGINADILFERCCVDVVSDILARKNFAFFSDWGDADYGAIMDAVRMLLLPPVSSGGTEYLVRSALMELSKGPVQLHVAEVRRLFVRVLLSLSRYAFVMRPFAVNEEWAERRLTSMQQQARLADELGMHGFEVPPSSHTVVDDQLLLIEFTVRQLCQVAVKAFPALLPCETALRANTQTWAARSEQPNASRFLHELLGLALSPPLLPPHGGALADGEGHSAITGNTLGGKKDIDRGSLLVDTARFVSFQKELISVYEENASLRESLEAVLKAVEVAPVCAPVSA